MSDKLPGPSHERWVDRGDGVLHLIDAQGSVIAVQKPPKGGVRRVQDKRTHVFMTDKNGRKVWVPKGTDQDLIDGTEYPASEATWRIVCELIAQGKTLAAIGRMEEMPPERALRHWKYKIPEFKAMYEQAKRDRAEFRADQVVEIADMEGVKEEDVPFQRLRKDVLQFGAEMDDRESFGKQVKNIGDGNKPTVFIINTGVPEAPAIEVKSEVSDVD